MNLRFKNMTTIQRTAICFSLLAITFVPTGAHSSWQANDDFKVFWEKFKTAVVKGDKATVASLSKFPVGMSYGIRSVKNRTDLARRYREVFNKQTDAAKCFGTKEPEKDETNPRKFSVACPDAAGNDVVIYEFERSSLGWKFVRLDNINE